MKKGNYILWLPSWYPNAFEPTNGDFIQRHAQSASLFGNITLIHFTQLGEHIEQPETYETIHQSGNLKEIISYIGFKRGGIPLIDKINYNRRFYRNAKKYLTSYFKEFGLPNVVHVHIPMKAGVLAIWLQKTYGIKYIVSEHSSYYYKEAPRSYFDRHLLYRQKVKAIFKQASAVTNVSGAVGKILQQLFSLKKVITIHNVVNTNVFTIEREKHEVFTFIHVSSLSEQKNIDALLNTFAKLKDVDGNWQLLLVGPDTKELIKKTIALGLKEHVHFTGEINYKDVALQMQRAHVKVLFSKHENFPCTIIEALCCGLPVVSSDIAGIKEAVNETNGLLVSMNDENAFLDALIRIKANYGQYQLEAISRAARAKYNYKVIGGQIFNLYTHNSLS